MKERIIKDFQKLAITEKSEIYARFFKTDKGEYGYGDKFLGVDSPSIKLLVKKHREDLSEKAVVYFLKSPIHEHRVFALEILKYRYSKGDQREREIIVKLYLNHLKYINNWDLVDISAYHILGNYLLDRSRDILYDLAKSTHLWSQRVAIISTFAFIKEGDFKDTLKISKLLLNHKHDLIHKAIGWMLREIYKRDNVVTEDFIKKNYDNVPRTTLRYAIEKMEEDKRQRFLKGEF